MNFQININYNKLEQSRKLLSLLSSTCDSMIIKNDEGSHLEDAIIGLASSCSNKPYHVYVDPVTEFIEQFNSSVKRLNLFKFFPPNEKMKLFAMMFLINNAPQFFFKGTSIGIKILKAIDGHNYVKISRYQYERKVKTPESTKEPQPTYQNNQLK